MIDEPSTADQRIVGTLTFSWQQERPMPAMCAHLRRVHLSDLTSDGILVGLGTVNYRVNRFMTSIDRNVGTWLAEVGIELL